MKKSILVCLFSIILVIVMSPHSIPIVFAQNETFDLLGKWFGIDYSQYGVGNPSVVERSYVSFSSNGTVVYEKAGTVAEEYKQNGKYQVVGEYNSKADMSFYRGSDENSSSEFYSTNFIYDPLSKLFIKKDDKYKFYAEYFAKDLTNPVFQTFQDNGIDKEYENEKTIVFENFITDDVFELCAKFNEKYEAETKRIVALLLPLLESQEKEALNNEQKEFETEMGNDSFVLANMDKDLYQQDYMYYGSLGRCELALATVECNRSRCIEVTRRYCRRNSEAHF
ncbi:MAG: hypothetical protein FWF69_01465 [Firmicutes bacterium]|nr:hypothetical protein [Bacillota bacterium]